MGMHVAKVSIQERDSYPYLSLVQILFLEPQSPIEGSNTLLPTAGELMTIPIQLFFHMP